MVKTVLIDFHGTLTDGRLHMSSDGKTMFEAVHVRDLRAIRELLARGFEVIVVTASDSEIIKQFCARVGCGIIVERDKIKLRLPEKYWAIGDDVFDIPMLVQAVISACPSDALNHVKERCTMVLETKGGQGVVAEFLTKIPL